jgi:hypothetical protein
MGQSERSSRTFTDAKGISWTVREIANPSVPPKLATLLGNDRRQGGWLVFESSNEKRRLSPYPTSWLSFTDAELEASCGRAVSAPPAPARRAPDQ